MKINEVNGTKSRKVNDKTCCNKSMLKHTIIIIDKNMRKQIKLDLYDINLFIKK